MRWRRVAIMVAAIAIATAAATVVADGRPPPATHGPTGADPLRPPPRVLVGAYVELDQRACSTTGALDAVQAFEAPGCLGERLLVTRRYVRWGEPVPDVVRQDCAAGRTPHVSVKPVTRSGEPVPWASIAAGRQDAAIDAFARGLRAVRGAAPACTLWVTFDHEADLDVDGGFSGYDLGAPATFAAAWRHVFDRLAVDGAASTWIRRVLVLDHWTYPRDAGRFDPGAGYVDAYGVDAFNRPYCHPEPWRSLASLAAGALGYARSRGAPLFVTEFGSVSGRGDPLARAHWLDAAASWIGSNPDIRAAVYWNGASADGCDYRINDDRLALRAFASLVARFGTAPTPWTALGIGAPR
jgi:hypothetical protein